MLDSLMGVMRIAAATGSDIDPQSLALAGNILYWIQGGMPLSTRLN